MRAPFLFVPSRCAALAAALFVASCSSGAGNVPDDSAGAASSSAIDEGEITLHDEMRAGPLIVAPEVSTHPGDWAASISEATVMPVLDIAGARYVQIADMPFLEHPLLEGRALPDCWYSAECFGDALELDPATVAGMGHARSAAIITAEGRCTAWLGPPIIINRSVCIENAALVQRVVGCDGEVAPIAWASDAPPADVTYHAPTFSEPIPWLTTDGVEPELGEWTSHPAISMFADRWRLGLQRYEVASATADSRMDHATLDVGAETMAWVRAGAQTTDTEECDTYQETFYAAGVASDDGWTLLVEDAIDGVLVQDGRAEVFLAATEYTLDAYRRTEGGAEPQMSTSFRRINEECREFWPLEYEYPCGP